MGYLRLIRVNAWRIPNITAKLEEVLRQAVRKHALRITDDIRKSFKLPKHGRIYYYKGKRITASAPGEAPAIRSGRLFRNVTPIFQNKGMQAKIDPLAKGVRYAAWLELGTTKMEPRPYINPAFARRRQAFLNEVRTKLAKSFSGS